MTHEESGPRLMMMPVIRIDELWHADDDRTDEPRRVVLRLELDTGAMTCAYMAALPPGWPEDVIHGRHLVYPIPPLTARAANRLMAEAAPYAARVLAGARVVYDGENWAGVLGPAAEQAWEEVADISADAGWIDPVDGIADPRSRVIGVTMGEWAGDIDPHIILREQHITGESTDADLDAAADRLQAEAGHSGEVGYTVLHGTTVWLAGHRDRLRAGRTTSQ